MNWIETTCGRYAIVNGVYFYEGDSTDNGFCYKNLDAWKNNAGVIYIGEYSLEACETDLYWTKEEWVQWVKDYIQRNYSDVDSEIVTCDAFIEDIAYDCLYNADWSDLTTMLFEFDYNDDWVLDNWEEWKKKHS